VVTTAFSQPLSADAEERLLSFCELYSTVKYYYPEPNLQDFPWDAFAYQGYKIATTSKSDKEFVKKTKRLFWTIAPGVQISKKEFDLVGITPKKSSFYQKKAFWQHQGGLNVERASYTNHTTLNYIYKQPTDIYRMDQWIEAESKGLCGKKLRFSLLAKVEDNTNSIKVFSFKTTNRDREDAKIAEVSIKVSGNKWKRYTVEMEHPDSVVYSIWTFFHPRKGTVYVDDLKLERFENDNWEEIEIFNSNFENYSSEGYLHTSSGYLNGWRNMFYFGALAVADSINAVEGKYCLKLPTVQDKLLYPPTPIDQPYMVSLPIGYKAYVPLQLYADEKTVFPVTDKQIIKNFTEKLLRDSLNTNQLAIACVMQTWAALYHDYFYREDDFEEKLNQLLFQTIYKLNTINTTTSCYKILAHDFLLWINDPHLRLSNGIKFLTDNKTHETRINIPVQCPDLIRLTETQCVVANVIDSVTSLQIGDVILQINDISIDSLLQLYRAHNISRSIQLRALKDLMVIYGKTEVKVQLLRNGETVDVVFSTYTRQGDWSETSLEKKNREKYQDIQDSLKEATELFYLNPMYPPDVFNRSVLSEERILNRYQATDSLITELNQYKALILDVRGYPNNAILPSLAEYMGIPDYDRGILKTAFYPVAQFNKRYLPIYVPEREENFIQVPVYVLIDHHTISFPERVLFPVKKSGRATFIGSNTAGAAGFVCKTKITDSITLHYTTGTGQKASFDDNPMSYQGTGIAPDIYVYPTPQGIAAGRDEVLEKAIEVALKDLEKNE